MDGFRRYGCDLTAHNHGTTNKIIRWQSYLCKLTDSSGNLLYKDAAHDQPAVFNTLKDAFTALTSGGTLYQGSGVNAYNGTNEVKVEMLRDYTQPKSDSPDTTIGGVSNTANRSVTLKTAGKTVSDSDVYIYNPAAGVTGDRQTYATITRGYTGASMFMQNIAAGTLILTGIILDGNKDIDDPNSDPVAKYTATGNGGIVNVTAGTLKIGENATLKNSKATKGGAVYVKNGATAEMTSGTINKNEATTAGAGIYLEEGSTLKLSGNPNFGGADLYTEADKTAKRIPQGKAVGDLKGTDGNFLTTAPESGAQNGGQSYSRARQDIFIEGYIGETAGEPTKATSVKVTGEITSGDGTIWVWAEIPSTANENNHYQQLRQFAMFALPQNVTLSEDEKESTMKAFRNAVDDEQTDCSGEYLYGVFSDDDDTKSYIYWSGVSGYRKVILRKVAQDTYESLKGAEFTVYRGSGSKPYVLTDQNDKTKKSQLGGTNDTLPTGAALEPLTSLESGVFWIGELPYGTYYFEETAGPTSPAGYSGNGGKWFYFILDGEYQYMSPGYSGREAAKTEADADNAALKLAKQIIAGKTAYASLEAGAIKEKVKTMLTEMGYASMAS